LDCYQSTGMGLEVEDRSGLDGSKMSVLAAIADKLAYASFFPTPSVMAAGACSYR
jgi:hypothetical protein